MDTVSSLNGQGDKEEKEVKVCRDFMRNVCNRGNSCRFIHPNDLKIKTDPIFCHDYQQSKCFRSTCKFIHCSREEEEHYKTTGELPEAFTGEELYPRTVSRGGGRGKPRGSPLALGRGGRGAGRGRGTWVDNDDPDIPYCKDYLKGVCDRPPGGCKFRHVDNPGRSFGAGTGGAGSALARRRLAAATFFDDGPETKRTYSGYGTARMGSAEFEDYYTSDFTNPPPPPPAQPYALTAARTDTISAAAMKTVEDENYMLKRRIEELKKQVSDLVATNEYLLSQNATLRLSSMNNSAEKQASAGTVSVSAASLASLVSMASQPSIGLTSAVSQSLSTMTTLPSVSMSMTPVSISQPLEAAVVTIAQHQPTVYPIVTSQGVLPPGT